MPYPPAPWRLKGEGFILLQTLSLSRAQPLLPAGVKPVPVPPGRTIGGIYIGHYGSGSSLEYHELIVIPALVWHRGRLGGWISHIYVDDERSLLGGREIWGLPKQLARFETRGDELCVSADGRRLAVFRLTPANKAWPLPLLAPAFGQRDGAPCWFRGSGSVRLGPATGSVEVPDESPFASLGLGRGRSFTLQGLDLTVQPPA